MAEYQNKNGSKPVVDYEEIYSQLRQAAILNGRIHPGYEKEELSDRCKTGK